MARLNRPVSQRQSWWLLASALAAFAPLTPYIPTWLIFLAATAFCWRAAISVRQWHLPPRWVLIVLVLSGTAAIFAEYRSLAGRTPGMALLVIYLALKLLELRAARDAIVTCLLCYFLVLGQFLFTQTIPTALMACLTVVLTTASLLAASDDRPAPLLQLRRAGLMLAQALPFMLLLFVLFPRIQGPLWGIPQDRFAAQSGLSDTMSPGSIAQISQSDAVAFRVRFSGAVPPQSQLYWRGPVMPLFDGRTWRVSQNQGTHPTPPYTLTGTPVDYEVTLEPHGKFWLFALEMPGTLPPDSMLTGDYQPIARTAVRTRLRYTQRAWPDTLAGVDEPRTALRESLTLPKGGNPRIRALAEQWRARHGEDGAAILQEVENLFRTQLLTYTLNPPLLGVDSVDEFLFDTRRGFCEHFASAFVFALRAAGVPARVVAGYQGGELNPIDNYLVVRQYDAHAWTEVWIAGRGWQRLDPTAISAPSRLAGNVAAALPEGESPPLMLRGDLAWLRELRNRLDAVTNGWNQWVLGYNPQKQREFLQSLGLREPDWQGMTAILAVLCGGLMLGLALWIMYQREHIDPALALWRRFAARLAKQGVTQYPWEGPQAFARRAAAQLPEHAATVSEITERYVGLRYARPTDATARDRALAELKTRIAAFKP